MFAKVTASSKVSVILISSSIVNTPFIASFTLTRHALDFSGVGALQSINKC